MLRAIDEIRPTWVVGENVAGLTTMVEGGVLTPMGCDPVMFGEGDGLHRYELRQSFTIERICRDLEGLGYSVQPMLIPAAGVNAPHQRYRVFILAHASHSEELCLNVRISGNPFGFEQPQQQFGDGNIENVADTKGKQGDKLKYAFPKNSKEEQIKFGGRNCEDCTRVGDRSKRFGNHDSFAYTYRKRLQTTLQSRSNEEEGREGEERHAFITSNNAWAEGTWWKYYPSVSPVHAGNDGLPIRMDGASIPFTKWRTEALKAYGNAIVPQVMYRIFQAIELCQ